MFMSRPAELMSRGLRTRFLWKIDENGERLANLARRCSLRCLKHRRFESKRPLGCAGTASGGNDQTRRATELETLDFNLVCQCRVRKAFEEALHGDANGCAAQPGAETDVGTG